MEPALEAACSVCTAGVTVLLGVANTSDGGVIVSVGLLATVYVTSTAVLPPAELIKVTTPV
jgi:hypothetical protein